MIGPWHPARGRTPALDPREMVFVRGRYGDIYGPIPVEIISTHAWAGNMLHAAHDLTDYARASDSGSDRNGEDAAKTAAECEASQSGPNEDSGIAQPSAKDHP